MCIAFDVDFVLDLVSVHDKCVLYMRGMWGTVTINVYFSCDLDRW